MNKQIQAAGIAIKKLNEIAAALSLSPTRFTCFKKNTNVSYNGTPLNPGRTICFVLYLIKLAGRDCNMRRSTFSKVE